MNAQSIHLHEDALRAPYTDGVSYSWTLQQIQFKNKMYSADAVQPQCSRWMLNYMTAVLTEHYSQSIYKSEKQEAH